MVTQFPLSFYQGFATRTYKAKLLKFKPWLIQRAPKVTTVLSGLCTTSSPESTPSNALPQHQLETLSSFIMLVGFSVKSHKTVHNYVSALLMLLCSFDSAAFDDIRVKLTLKGLEKLKRHIPLRKLPITPDMLYNSVSTWISGTLPTSPYGQLCLSASSHSSELQTYSHRLEKHFPPSLPCHVHVRGCGNYSDVDKNQTIRRHCFGSANPLYS